MINANTIAQIIRMRTQNIPYGLCTAKCGVSDGTVTRTMNRFKELGIPLECLESLPDDEILEMFYPLEARRRRKFKFPDYEAMAKRLEEEGSRLNMSALWYEYQEENGAAAYGYTQFVKYFREYLVKAHGPEGVKMLIDRVPGERLYVDWMGDQPELLMDPKTGEVKKVHIFCAAIGVSSLGYMEAFADEKTEAFVTGIVHALKYYGALPRFITCDNLKTGVTRNTKDQILITQACRDLEAFYGVIMLPAPPIKPTAKGSVEHMVRTAETHYVEELKAEFKSTPFLSVTAINEKGAAIVDKLNNRLWKGRKSSRRDIFERIDLPAMHTLPVESMDIWGYVCCEKVPPTYHITFDGHQYSVPYTYAHRPAVLKYSSADIVITDDRNRAIAKHKRLFEEYPKKSTNPKHLHPSHTYYAMINEMDGAVYRSWAAQAGPNTSEVMERLLNGADHEEQMYERVARILFDSQDVSADVIERAADICLNAGAVTCTEFLRCIREMCRNAPERDNASDMAHTNMRGREYYR